MTDSIVRNSTPAAPIAGLVFVIEHEAELEAGTVVQRKLHSAGYNVVLRPAGDRAGRLQLGFRTAAAAYAAVAILRTAHTYTLTADVPALSMTFVVAGGSLRPRLAVKGAAEWTLDVPFVELAA